MPLLANCVVNTLRPVYTASTGGSSAPQTYQFGLSGHVMPHRTFFNPHEMTPMREGGGLDTEFAIKFDKDADVRTGDVVQVYRIDGITPWPGVNVNETWRVNYDYLTPPGFLEEKVCVVTRITGGGPTY